MKIEQMGGGKTVRKDEGKILGERRKVEGTMIGSATETTETRATASENRGFFFAFISNLNIASRETDRQKERRECKGKRRAGNQTGKTKRHRQPLTLSLTRLQTSTTTAAAAVAAEATSADSFNSRSA